MKTELVIGYDRLVEKPYSNPHHTRDETVAYIRPESYLLPIGYKAPENYAILNLSFEKSQSTAWKVDGKNLYVIKHDCSEQIMYNINEYPDDFFVNRTSLIKWMDGNRYVTKRLFFCEFSEIHHDNKTEPPTPIAGFLVRSKDLVISSVLDQLDPSSIKPSPEREVNPNVFES
jgi:hypothetical protein